MKDVFRTISGLSEGEYREKGSKFIGLAYPAEDGEEIKRLLEQIRKSHHHARHCCFAWRLGINKERSRSSDDGEPSGCAGKPILSQIHSHGLTNVLVIVVRYFGGTLLGRAGLTGAYRKAAREALKHCTPVEVKIKGILKVEFEYPQMNAVMSVIKEHDLEYTDHRFDNVCSLQLQVWDRIRGQVVDKLMKIEGCQVQKV